MQIAIDGPSGAGKSTIARALAGRLGFTYIDTGAMYRAVGLKALRLGLMEKDGDIVDMARRTQVALESGRGEGQRVLLDGEDVTDRIRAPEVSLAASRVSALPAVRERLVELQRRIAGEKDVVMDGRDIAARVLPQARHKFFLTATAEERARRRFVELREKGQDVSLQQVLRDINQRDWQDINREASPLRQTPDAVLVDSTHMTFEQVLSFLLERVKD